MRLISVINGPNLNMLGTREKETYGNSTLQEINEHLIKTFQGKIQFDFFQSNHEGEIVDYIQKTKASAIIINPGAFTHTSIAIRDALLSVKLPTIEVHLSNIYKREAFRKTSYISDIALGVISGLGSIGYELAANALINLHN